MRSSWALVQENEVSSSEWTDQENLTSGSCSMASSSFTKLKQTALNVQVTKPIEVLKCRR